MGDWTSPGILTNLLLAGISAVYVALTYKILRESRFSVSLMRQQIENTTRPYIVVDVFNFVGSPLLKLRIRNLGTSVANNLQLTLDKSFERIDKRDMKDLAAFNAPIPAFAPRSELVFDLGLAQDIFGNVARKPTDFTIIASYDFGDKNVTEATRIDLHMFHGAAANPEPLVQKLDAIGKALVKLSSK
jgi:hypothetical protein